MTHHFGPSETTSLTCFAFLAIVRFPGFTRPTLPAACLPWSLLPLRFSDNSLSSFLRPKRRWALLASNPPRDKPDEDAPKGCGHLESLFPLQDRGTPATFGRPSSCLKKRNQTTPQCRQLTSTAFPTPESGSSVLARSTPRSDGATDPTTPRSSPRHRPGFPANP